MPTKIPWTDGWMDAQNRKQYTKMLRKCLR